MTGTPPPSPAPAVHALRFSGGRDVPLVLQAEQAECGLACLAMIAGAHGRHEDLPSMRARSGLSLKGQTLDDLCREAAAIGLMPRAVRLEPAQLPDMLLPCVLHWDLNHFVVLVAVRRGTALIHDPARGVRRLSLAELSGHFTGVALELTPGPGFAVQAPRRRTSLRALLGRVQGLRRSMAQVLLLALLLEGFVLLSPLFVQVVVDDIVVTGDRDLLAALGLGFVLLVGIQVATAAVRAWAVLHLSATLNVQWVAQVFAHLVRLPVSWFERRQVGDIWSRFASVQQIQKTLTTSFVEALLDGLLVLLTLAMMAWISPLLAAVAAGAVALYAALRALSFGPMRTASEEALVHDARQSGHFLETLRGMSAIKLFNAQATRQSRFMNHVVDTMNADIAVRRIEIAMALSQRLLWGLERVGIVWLGALLVLDQRLSLGLLFAFMAYKEQFALRAGTLIDRVVDVGMLRLQGDRLADIVESEPEAVQGAGGAAPLPADAALELHGVHFAYGRGDAPVLRGVDLRIEAGTHVALAGPSGCGKTTLLKLMLGLLVPDEGEVRVGGVPIQRLGLAAWRAQVGVVMQDEPLFAGSVADNITFFDPAPDRDWMVECARLAGVKDEIEALPMGWQTLVGDLGSSLSGGQRQRVALARALYRRPRWLFLDEATSALDVDGERRVNQAIRGLPLTRIVIAHRPETLASAPRVVVLGEGRVVQDLRTMPGDTARGS